MTAASGKTSGPQKSNLQRKRAGKTVSAAVLLTGTAHGKYRGTSGKQQLVFEEVRKFSSILTSKASRCLFPTWESDGTKAVYKVTYSSTGLQKYSNREVEKSSLTLFLNVPHKVIIKEIKWLDLLTYACQ